MSIVIEGYQIFSRNSQINQHLAIIHQLRIVLMCNKFKNNKIQKCALFLRSCIGEITQWILGSEGWMRRFNTLPNCVDTVSKNTDPCSMSKILTGNVVDRLN